MHRSNRRRTGNDRRVGKGRRRKAIVLAQLIGGGPQLSQMRRQNGVALNDTVTQTPGRSGNRNCAV